MRVALVNTNRIHPPIAPIGLDYVAEALAAAGHHVELLDLCWEEDVRGAIARFFSAPEFGLAGVTLRNTDDCGFTSRKSFVPGFVDLVRAIRAHTGAPIVAGGAGFSVMPEPILALCGADAGVWGEGESVFPELAARIQTGADWRDLPNVVWSSDGTWRRNPPVFHPLTELPLMTRRWVDNRRYFHLGGQAGFETRRGCNGQCIYCADPVAKGATCRTRTPRAVAAEVERLLEQGIDHLHTCDGEFNMPAWHAFDVCEEFIRLGLGKRLRWYAYCSPALFSPELARVMRQAGCVGINFGADNGDGKMLQRLKRNFGPEDIVNASAWSRDAGLRVMLDLLLGSPGESRQSLTNTIELMKRARPDRVGVSVGVRVYPGTELARQLGPGEDDPAAPRFYLEPAVAPFIFDLLDNLIAGDERFLFHDPTRPERNYNYNDNQRLVDAIAKGFRGAYWDL